jgi:hypothetical protein
MLFLSVLTLDNIYILLACVAALGESRACTKPPALPYLLVLSEDEKSDWFKMKLANMLIYAKIHTNTADVLLRGVSLSFAFKRG